MNRYLAFCSIAGLAFLSACSDGSSGPANACNNDFDQPALFSQMADAIVLPGYQTLLDRTTLLEQDVKDFVNAPSIQSLQVTRESWKAAYLSWQAVAPFDFGPSEAVFLASSVNNFPLNIPELEANLQRGSWDLERPDAYDKGFPALDYLLFGLGANDEEIVQAYTLLPDADTRRAYLLDVSADIRDRVESVQQSWRDSYRETFIQQTGTAAGSSLSLLINHWNKHYEILKRDRIGIPSGILTLGFTNPDQVEAPHSGISAELARASLQGIETIYRGKGGLGLDDYLEYIGAEKDGASLNTLIRQQFVAAMESLAKIQDPLREAVDADNGTVIEAYNDLTRQVVNIKTDLPTALCVSITYIDNPSDSD